MTINFRKLSSEQDRWWREAWELYEKSFPNKERRPYDTYVTTFANELFIGNAIECDGRFAGILYYWQGDGYLYLEHLAVDPAMRGGSIGSKTLEALETLCGKEQKIILEIDPPIDDISRRRKGFYIRSGFCANERLYIHPSYSTPAEPHRLVLMSYPTSLSERETDDFERFISTIVLK